MSDIFSGLANLTKSVTDSLNTYELRKIGDKVQGYVMNFTEAETKVREATNEDPWGPTGPQMQEIAHMTFQYDAFPEIMGMLWKRMLQENKAAWRRVYKSLILLNYLLKNGNEKGKDQGVNVRHRAKLVSELIQDEELLRTERRKVKTEGKEKYQGYSKEEMNMKGGTSSFDSKWKNDRKNDFRDDDFSSRDNDRDFSSPQREVTAFDFAESRNQTASPELGIRERSPEPQDDDDFGDFAEARNTGSTAQRANLLDLDFGSPAPPVHTQQLDLFNNISPISSGAQNLPRPPSGGSAQAPSNNLDDLFGSPVTANVPAPRMTNSASLDIFGDFTAPAPPVQSTPAPNLLGGFPTSSIQTSSQINDDLFGNFTSVPTPSLPPQTSIDLFSSAPAQLNPVSHVSSSISAPNFMDFQSPLAPMPAQTIPSGSGNLSARSGSSMAQNQIKPEPKLAGTWAELQGKVNIDLDNLSLRSPKKQSVPMNQLKGTQTQNNSGLNW
uniref:ENTH domain-containing protein n=1 Tax=Acrobeloides nanus TaxID=290746 RepID=A0A914E6P9_9BILA